MSQWLHKQVLRNTFEEALRKFDNEVWPKGSIPERNHVNEFLEDLREDLSKFCQDEQKRAKALPEAEADESAQVLKKNALTPKQKSEMAKQRLRSQS